MKDLYIIGAGGLGREVLWLVREINQVTPTYNLCGFVDDNQSQQGQDVCGIPVVGGVDFLRTKPGCSAALGIGIPKIKQKILNTLQDYELEWPALVAPQAMMSEFVTLGRGTVICAGSIVTTQVVIEDFVLVNLSCTIGHDVTIRSGCTLSPGVNMSGFVSVGQFTDIGTSAAIIPGIQIGAHSVVGAGSVVIRDIPDHATVVGNPGRVIKQADAKVEKPVSV